MYMFGIEDCVICIIRHVRIWLLQLFMKYAVRALYISSPLSHKVVVLLLSTLMSLLLSTSSSQSSLKRSPCYSHMLCRTQHAATCSGGSDTSVSFLFNKHRHLPLSRPYASSTTTQALRQTIIKSPLVTSEVASVTIRLHHPW